MPYQATWFDQNIPYWKSYLSKFVDKPINALEVGCFEGRATTWLLTNILTHPESKITVIDTFQGSPEFPQFGIDSSKIKTNFDNNTREFKDRVQILTGISQDNLPQLQRAEFDLIYIDGSHNCLDVLRDGIYAFDLLKPGGVIIFDDYNWDPGMGENNRPHKAIQALVSIWGGYYGKWKFWLDQAAFTKF